MRTPEDVVALVAGLAEDLAEQGTAYAEVAVTPFTHLHCRAGIVPDELAAALETGARRARESRGVELAPLIVTGFGMSFTMPATTASVMEATPSGRAGVASGVTTAARQAGGVVGVALLGTLVARHGHLAAGVHVAIALAAAAFCAAAAVTAACVAHPAKRRTSKERRG